MSRIPYDQREAKIRAAVAQHPKRSRRSARKGPKAAFELIEVLVRRAERRGLAAGLAAGVCCRTTGQPCPHSQEGATLTPGVPSR